MLFTLKSVLPEVGPHEQQLVPYIFSRNTRNNAELKTEVSVFSLYVNLISRNVQGMLFICCLPWILLQYCDRRHC